MSGRYDFKGGWGGGGGIMRNLFCESCAVIKTMMMKQRRRSKGGLEGVVRIEQDLHACDTYRILAEREIRAVNCKSRELCVSQEGTKGPKIRIR